MQNDQMEKTGRPTYLIVADDTEEFNNALRYACLAARANGAHIGIVYVIAEPGFFIWGNVVERMQQDRRQEAQERLRKVAEKVKTLSGAMPSLFVGEGERAEAIIKTIRENPDITKLILGGSTKSGGPGPLVSFFMGKGISRLPVPLTVIPDHIPLENLSGFV